MNRVLENFFNSGAKFTGSELDIKSKVQMINVSLLLSGLGLIYGITVNLINNNEGLIAVELAALLFNVFLFFLLRKRISLLHLIGNYLTGLYTFFFIFLIYVSEPNSLRHIWLFAYPLVLLYFQGKKRGVYWLVLIVTLLLIAPFQPFVEVSYSFFQLTYLAVVFLITTLVIYFYQYKMDEVKELTLKQQKILENFNHELEKKVDDKTSELKELNELLEIKVQEKLDELIKRDRMLESQSKLAVMGEMISMIAHQWRQPLSTITLQISQLQFKKMLGEEASSEDIDKVLTQISNSVVYLSDTINDFLTYFHPDKEADEIDLHDLLQKAVNLAMPKAKKIGVEIIIEKSYDIEVITYINEFVQVAVNIINNAVDALEESNKDELKIKIMTQMQDDKVIINIIDNADGISDENIVHLFEPYFSTKGKNGTGLGLYMSQMIVQKQLNGTLEVDSSTNGSVFTITIPIHVD